MGGGGKGAWKTLTDLALRDTANSIPKGGQRRLTPVRSVPKIALPLAQPTDGCTGEENIPAQQPEAQAHAWLPCTHGDQGWPQGTQCPPRQG